MAYSEERIREFTDTFCALADRMPDAKNPEAITIRELLG